MQGMGVPRDEEKAAALYRKAGELGHRRAAYMLGECYRHGWGIAPDDTQAVTWYRRAVTLFDAKMALGDMYYEGRGVARNAREAYRWYEQALAQHEDAYALYCVGFCLLHGQGVRRDLRAALRHLRRAATLGDINAQFELGSAYYRGRGVARSPRLALKWLRQAAYHGHEEAQSFLLRLEQAAAD